MDVYQHTVRNEVTFRGVGLHSGKSVKLAIKPAEANSGIHFVRTDMDRKRVIPAFMNRVVDTRMATTLAHDDIVISTTEHLLGALYGLGIDNARIELDGPEVPIMDGSAAPFVRILKRVGRKRQSAKRWMIKITKEVVHEEDGKTIRVLPFDGFKVSCMIDFDHDLIRRQSYSLLVSSKKFEDEIASARTFGFVEEVEKLRQNGLALGGSLQNAVVVDRLGVVNEEGLRFSDEFARHKVLDLIGDIALLGFPLLGHVVAHKSGHGQHLALMKAISAHPECWKYVEISKNGERKVLKQVAVKTREAGNKILPFLVPPSIAFAGETCSG